MSCFDLPFGLAQCIAVAKPWLELIVGFFGISTFALVSYLTWVLGHLRDANVGAVQDKEKAVRERDKFASDLENKNMELGAVKYQLDICTSSKNGDVSELGQKLQAALTENSHLQARLSLVRSMTTDGDASFWSRPPQQNRRDREYELRLSSSIPIVLFANQKGGVGKSTLTTNLGAAFADMNERVLVVDLDYQGTTSAQMIRHADLKLGMDLSRVDQLLLEKLRDRWESEILQVHQNLYLIPADYNLETLERREEYRWALDESPDDVRYRLARALLSDHVRNTYSMVLIDAPPRMTLGFLNGFCASTHLFVPTVVDAASARAVGRFAQQFKRLVPSINPRIEFAGIIGTMTNGGPVLPRVNEGIANMAEQQARRELGENSNLFMRDAVMSRSAPLAAGTDSGIAFWQAPETQTMFNAIAKSILARVRRTEP